MRPARFAREARSRRAQLSTRFRDPFAAGIPLAENPNRGKRHTARMLGVDSEAPEYSPLRVTTTYGRSRQERAAMGIKRRFQTSYTV